MRGEANEIPKKTPTSIIFLGVSHLYFYDLMQTRSARQFNKHFKQVQCLICTTYIFLKISRTVAPQVCTNSVVSISSQRERQFPRRKLIKSSRDFTRFPTYRGAKEETSLRVSANKVMIRLTKTHNARIVTVPSFHSLRRSRFLRAVLREVTSARWIIVTLVHTTGLIRAGKRDANVKIAKKNQ